MTDGCPSLYPDLTGFNYTHGNSTTYTKHARVGAARSVSAPVASYVASQRIESNYQRRPSDSSLNTHSHGQHDEPPQGRTPKRRKVSRPLATACPQLMPKSRYEYPMGTLERVFSCMDRPLETKRRKVRGSISAASKNDTKSPTEVNTNGGVVYCFVIQDDSSAAEKIVKIGYTTRPIEARQKELESCFSREHKLIHESSYRKSVHFERLERLILDNLESHCHYFTCVRCLKIRGEPANHAEYFKISPDKALRIINRWRTWLDAQPYEPSGTLSPIWHSRLVEVRALLPTRDTDSIDLDVDAILDFVTQPFTMPQHIALRFRSFVFSPANAGRLRFSRFQKVESIVRGLSFHSQSLMIALLVICFMIWPTYTVLFIVLGFSLGAMLWWIKYEYERKLLKLIEGA